MWLISGWIIWGILVFFALSFAFGCRTYMKRGQGFQMATGVQTFFFWIIAILFVLFGWNKLHILWLFPVAFFTAQFFSLRSIPLLSSVVLFFTRIFLSLILLGIKPASITTQE